MAKVNNHWDFYFCLVSPPPPLTSFPSILFSSVIMLLLSRPKSHSFTEGERVLKYQIYQKTSATCKSIVLLLYDQAVVNSFKSVTYFTLTHCVLQHHFKVYGLFSLAACSNCILYFIKYGKETMRINWCSIWTPPINGCCQIAVKWLSSWALQNC